MGIDRFKALMVTKDNGGQSVNWETIGEADLMDGDVTVRVSHSTINYKDGLAIIGKAPVIRRWPMIPGIDFAGVVESSQNGDFVPGDMVLLNGWGLGETHYGGYSEYARVQGDWLIHSPKQFTPSQAMAIGTAGYTAMLAVLALESRRVTPESGPILVTGAAGGVGSIAIAILTKLGFDVVASTGRLEESSFLRELGAADVLDRTQLSSPGKPLGKEQWAGAIDVAGSHTLANVLGQMRYGGTVAACGLAQGMDLPITVAPFILRGVTLVGIDSVMAPRSKRIDAWMRLALDLKAEKLDAITATYPIDQVTTFAPEILAGKVRGRIVLDLS